MLATQIVSPPPTDLDDQAFDAILAHLEPRYGSESRLHRADRVVSGRRVKLASGERTTGLVNGDSGKSYWATADACCAYLDATNVYQMSPRTTFGTGREILGLVL